MQFIIVILAISGAAFSLPQYDNSVVFNSEKVGWKNVSIQDYNYFASIQQILNGMAILTDTGIIINNRWILTGGQYINDVAIDDITVEVGKSSSDVLVGKRLKVSKVVPHPKYNSSTPETSLSLLQLAEPLEVSKTVGFASFGSTLPKNNDNVAIVGFGKSIDDASTPLRRLDLVSCSHYFEGHYLLCTNKTAAGPFQEDYGVALLYKEKIVGLNVGDYYSYSFLSTTMALFLDITDDLYQTWIENTVNEVNL